MVILLLLIWHYHPPTHHPFSHFSYLFCSFYADNLLLRLGECVDRPKQGHSITRTLYRRTQFRVTDRRANPQRKHFHIRISSFFSKLAIRLGSNNRLRAPNSCFCLFAAVCRKGIAFRAPLSVIFGSAEISLSFRIYLLCYEHHCCVRSTWQRYWFRISTDSDTLSLIGPYIVLTCVRCSNTYERPNDIYFSSPYFVKLWRDNDHCQKRSLSLKETVGILAMVISIYCDARMSYDVCATYIYYLIYELYVIPTHCSYQNTDL